MKDMQPCDIQAKCGDDAVGIPARYILMLANSDSPSNEPVPVCSKCLEWAIGSSLNDEPDLVFAVQLQASVVQRVGGATST
jgi:hypothetical protein